MRAWSLFLRLRLSFFVMGVTLILPTYVLHAQSAPHALNLSGGLFGPDGQPVLRSGINFKLEVRDKTGSCVLYSESHNGEDLSTTKGQFSLLLGSGASAQNFLAGGSQLDASVFLNRGVTGAFTGCPAGVTLASGDERVVRVYYDLGGGLTAMTPDVPIVSSAYAMVADSLQGKGAADFIQVKDDGSTAALNQANTEYAFSFANWPKLKALIDGTSSAYLPVGGTSPLDMNNQRIIRVANPGTSPFDGANKGYVDSSIGGRTADFTGVGPAVGDGKTMVWDQAAQKWVVGNPVISGTAGGDLSGTYPNPLIAANAVTTAKVADNAITSNKINTTGVAVNRLVATDATTGSTLTYFTCGVGEIMWWTATGWQCTTVAAQAPVKTVAGKTPNASGDVPLNAADISGLGTVVTKDFGSTSGQVPLLDASNHIPAYMLPTGTGTITSVNVTSPILGGGVSGAVTISLDVGTAANQVVRLNASAQLPAVDGSLLTGVNATKIGTRAVASTAPGASQVLAFNATSSQWEPMSAATGSVTSVVSGTGLVAGTITSAGTINVDVGTTAGKIVQFDGSARYPANDGSQITNVNATKIGTRAVASTAPTASQVLGYNATSSQWEPMTDGGGTVASVVSGTGLVAGTITTNGTLNVDVGTGAGKIVQLNGSAALPALDGSNLYGVNASKLGTRAVASSAPSSNQVLMWNGSQWEPANAASTLSWPLTATPGTTPASAPSYSFAGSTNTGLLSQATNTLSLATAGTTALTIDATGNIGVGTSQPGALLHVVGGSIANTATSNNNFGSNLSIQKSRASGIVQSNDELGYLSFMGHDGGTYRQGAYILGSVDATPSASSMPTRLVLATTSTGAVTSTERMRITSTGLVGIGTNAPLSILDVAATGTNSALILPRDTTAARPAANVANGMIRYNTSTNKFEAFENGSWANVISGGGGIAGATGQLQYNAGGNFGASSNLSWDNINGYLAVGVGSAAGELHVGDPSGTTAEFHLTNNTGSLQTDGFMARMQLGNVDLLNQENGYLNLGNAAASLYIDGTGRFGFATGGGTTNGAVAEFAGTGTSTSSILIPRANTAARPLGVNGMMRYNSQTSRFEAFENGVWTNMIAAGGGTTSFPLLASPGTTPVSAPSYSFNGDSNTGVLSQATDTLALATAGTARLSVDAIGNVGIGATSPSGYGTAGPVLHLKANGATAPEINLDATAGGGKQHVLVSDTDGTFYLWNKTDGVQGFGYAPSYGLFSQRFFAQGLYGSLNAGTDLILDSTYHATKGSVFIAPAGGNVGVGTASPKSVLDVVATGTNSALIVPRDTTAARPAGNVANGMLRYNTNTNKFEAYENGAWTNMITSGSGTVSWPLAAPNGSETAPSYAFAASGSTGFYSDAPQDIVFTSLGINTATFSLYGIEMYQPLATANGSVGTPEYGFLLDTDTGLYHAGANKLGLVTGGTSRLNIDSAGNVGVGTASPSVNLHVSAADTSTKLRVENTSSTASRYPAIEVRDFTGTFGGSPNINLVRARGTQASINAVQSGDTLGAISGYGAYAGSLDGSTSGSMYFESTETHTASASGGKVYFATTPNGSTAEAVRLTIDQNGNVGIGAGAPKSILELAATGTNSALLLPRDTTANRPSTNVANGMLRYNTNTNKFEAYENGAWTNMISAGGGTASFPLLASPGTTAPTAPSYSFSGSTNTGLFSPAVGTLALSAKGTTALAVAGNGYVGIGPVATPLTTVHIKTADDQGLMIDTIGTGQEGWISFAETGAARYILDKDTGNGLSFFSATGSAGSETFTDRLRLAPTGEMRLGMSGAVATPDLFSAIGNDSTVYSSSSGAVELPASTAAATVVNAQNLDEMGAFVKIKTQNNSNRFQGAYMGAVSNSAGYTPQIVFGQQTGATSYVERMRFETNGNLGVGTTSPLSALDVAATGTNSALVIPRDTTANRPSTNVANGMLRYNTSTNKFEAYENGAWTNMIGGASVSYPLLANPVGTQTAPAYSFNGRATTGMFSPGTSTLAFATNGSEALRIDYQGNIGIGGLPSAYSNVKMYISGGSIGFDDSQGMSWGSGGSLINGSGSDMTLRVNNHASDIYIAQDGAIGIGIGMTIPKGALDIASTGTNSAIIVPRATTANRPVTNVANGMIRYNTSTSKFEAYENGAWTNMVGGGAASFPLLASPGTTPASAPSYSFSGSTNTGLFSQAIGTVALATAGTTRLQVDGSGNFDLGVTGGSRLRIYGGDIQSYGPGDIKAKDGTGTDRAVLSSGGGNYGEFFLYNSSSTRTVSLTASTNDSYINSGKFGVGTTTPKAILDVASTGTNSAIIVPRDTTANRPAGNVANGMLRYNTNTNKFEAYENGAWANMIGGGGASTIDALTDARTTGGTDAMYIGAGVGASSSAAENTGVGGLAMQALTSGTENTAVGAQALKALTTGSYNTALGAYALSANQTGTQIRPSVTTPSAR